MNEYQTLKSLQRQGIFTEEIRERIERMEMDMILTGRGLEIEK